METRAQLSLGWYHLGSKSVQSICADHCRACLMLCILLCCTDPISTGTLGLSKPSRCQLCAKKKLRGCSASSSVGDSAEHCLMCLCAQSPVALGLPTVVASALPSCLFQHCLLTANVLVHLSGCLVFPRTVIVSAPCPLASL